MKRIILFFTLCILSSVNHAIAEDLSEDRKSELKNLLLQDCGSCHGMTLKGGIGPALTIEAVSDKSEDDLYQTISKGRPGTPMPPWKDILSEADIQWLVFTLKKGLDHEK